MSESSETIPLTALDEAFLNTSDTITWSIQFELELAGKIDPARLRRAVIAATATHPIARASLKARSALVDLRRYWEIPAELDAVDIAVVECSTAEDFADLRARLYEQPPDLDQSPPFELTVGRRSASDVLLFNFHHVAFDGVSVVRFIRSIALHYAEAPDPVGGPPLGEARDLRKIAGSRSAPELLSRAAGLAADGLSRHRGIARVAADGGTDGSKYQFGFTNRKLTAEQTKAAVGARAKGTTVNDLLLAALLLTIRAWNRDHGSKSRRPISAMMPINMRPDEWADEVVSNFASYVVVALKHKVPAELEAATLEVHKQTQSFKDNNSAGWVIDVLEPGNLLPVSLKRRLQKALPLVEKVFVESTVLSNLGRLDFPAFGEGGEVVEAWLTPPCFDPLAIAVGAASVNGELTFTFRYLTASLDQHAAERFADLFLRTLGVS